MIQILKQFSILGKEDFTKRSECTITRSSQKQSTSLYFPLLCWICLHFLIRRVKQQYLQIMHSAKQIDKYLELYSSFIYFVYLCIIIQPMTGPVKYSMNNSLSQLFNALFVVGYSHVMCHSGCIHGWSENIAGPQMSAEGAKAHAFLSAVTYVPPLFPVTCCGVREVAFYSTWVPACSCHVTSQPEGGALSTGLVIYLFLPS